MKYGFITFCALVISLQVAPSYLSAQQDMRVQEGREILKSKGITEEELRQRLIEKGYNPDNVKPEDIPEFQRVVEETIAELEAEKRVADTVTVQPDSLPEQEQHDTVPQKTVPEIKVKPSVPDTLTDQIYGHQLFRSESAMYYKQATDIAPPESYVMGVGDKLTVSIFGQSRLEESLVIDRQGFVKPANMFRIALRGKTLGEAKEILAGRYQEYYVFQLGEFDVTVNSVRSISVNIMGEVRSTGAITLPAINTVFNALVAAGGPTEIGSVRKIKLISGSEEKIFDVYKYMLDPREVDNFYLRENDYIHVPVAKRVVSIEGAVSRPMRYELVEGEDLKALIDYAGGLTADAYLKDIQISRFGEDSRLVINLNLRRLMEGDDDFILYNGDEISITSIDEPADNYAGISGAVVKPGRFALEPGMRISDLLLQSGLKKEARKDFAYILQYNPDGSYVYRSFSPQEVLENPANTENAVLSGKDEVQILSLKTFTDARYFSVAGSVRKPGRYYFDPGGGMQVRDAILIAGGALPRAASFAYIIRRSPGETQPEEYVAVPLEQALDPAYANDPQYLLFAYDSLYVFDQTRFLDEFYVTISGEVNRPGQFDWDESLTVTDALRLAGGLTYKAAYNRIDISRVVLSETEPTQFASFTVTVDNNLQIISGEQKIHLNPFDHIFVRSLPDFKLQRTILVTGEVLYPGYYPITKDNEQISSIIEKAGGLNEEAFPSGAQLIRTQDNRGPVVIQLETALNNPSSSQNLIVEGGDQLFIPRREDLVTIEGAVRLKDLYQDEFLLKGNKINVNYEKGKHAKYYIDNYAAGIAENGMKKLVTVEHQNGRVERTKDFGLFKVYPEVTPGSTIKVGRKPEKEESVEEEKEKVDWGQVFKDTLAQATAVLTLILLIDRTSN